jgi:fructose-bisphosphate aldolase class 1
MQINGTMTQTDSQRQASRTQIQVNDTTAQTEHSKTSINNKTLRSHIKHKMAIPVLFKQGIIILRSLDKGIYVHVQHAIAVYELGGQQISLNSLGKH